jgi:ATP-dependent RNA helicase RhlE
VRDARGRIPIRALILTPTRELAAQVEESVRTYGKYLPLTSMVMFGGVGMQPQIDKLRAASTSWWPRPGRLLDHHQQGTLDLKHVEIFVLDEADRMLDMGFIHDIKKVLAVLPAKKQSLLFSATFSDEIKALADRLLNKPALIEVARRNSHRRDHRAEGPPGGPREEEGTAGAPDQAGRLAPGAGLHAHEARRNRLAEYLNERHHAMAIHGNKSQGARTKALAEFKSGDLQVLVATDIAARGIDIDQLPHVVNFELPNVPEDYVHRIGRTGRAGAQGEAISLVCVDEDIFLRDIEKLIKRSIPREVVPGFEPPVGEKAEPIVLGRMTIGIGGTRRNAGGGGGGRPGGGGGGGGGGAGRPAGGGGGGRPGGSGPRRDGGRPAAGGGGRGGPRR